MRQNTKHNHMVMELNALLNNETTRTQTIKFLNTYDSINIEVNEEELTVKIKLESKSQKLSMECSLYKLTYFDGIIDLVVDELQDGFRLPYTKFYEFRDTIVTSEMYDELLSKYVKTFAKEPIAYENNMRNFEFSPLHANLNQVFIKNNEDGIVDGIIVHPRKHAAYHFTCGDEGLKAYLKSVDEMRFNLYSYLLGSYNEFVEEGGLDD